jgi:histone deacetylase complex regulatory component SIN3
VEQDPIYQPFFKPDYKLCLATQHMFVFFRQLYTIYERVIKAQQIITTLVEQELKLKNDENLTRQEAEIKKEKFEMYLAGLLSAIG